MMLVYPKPVPPLVDVEGPKYVQLKMNEFQALVPGTIVLVRSLSVPFLKDHFFVVTGPLVEKSHGLRPQGISLRATSFDSAILDQYAPINGVIILRLMGDHDIAKFMNRHKLSDIIL